MPTHNTGLWLTEDGEVVTSPPGGASTQIVAKGSEIGPQQKARLEALGVNEDGSKAVDEAAEQPTEDDAKPAKKAAAKK